MNGAELIAQERERQKTVEGYAEDHDDDHDRGELLSAALCYAQTTHISPLRMKAFVPGAWPFEIEEWKPTPDDPIRQLVKAGALIAAEIDRLQRKEKGK